ncbi:WapI family immunity protein [Spirosoma fluminis]
MRLTGPEGVFELTILDYEYSDAPRFLDRNWLIVSLKTQYHNRECVRTASILSTWELELLANWMQSVANEDELSPKLTFIEPALGFSNVSRGYGDYRFRIKLSSDAQPDWQREPVPFYLPVAPDKRELQGAISDLHHQLQRFPVRD